MAWRVPRLVRCWASRVRGRGSGGRVVDQAPGDFEDAAGDGDDGFGVGVFGDAAVAGAEEGFGAGRRRWRLGQGGFDPAVAFAGGSVGVFGAALFGVGASVAEEARWPGVGKMVMSKPVSATMVRRFRGDAGDSSSVQQWHAAGSSSGGWGVGGATQIARRKLRIRAHAAGKEPAAQGSIGQHGKPMLAGIRKNIRLDAPFEQIVGRLHGVQPRHSGEGVHLRG